MKIAIIGTGYVGLVTGTCFAEMGNLVTCVDIDQQKVDSLNNGVLPIYERGLKALVQQNQKAGRLFFTTDLEEGIENAKVIFLALPTPPGTDGSADLKYVLEVADQLGPMLTAYTIVVDKSTVPVGTLEKVAELIRSKSTVEFDVVSNPEFLREGVAIDDFMRPERVIVGTQSDRAKKIMETLYAPFVRQGNPIIFMDVRSAELTKYAANSFLATKITFMNEIAHLCERVGADVESVRKGMGTDSRIGNRFLFAGIGYGGSCFPKDVKALAKSAVDSGYEFKILNSVMEVNERQKTILLPRIKKHFGSLRNKTIAIWGLSFKPYTDDIREAPSLNNIDALLREGVNLRVHDPEAMAAVKVLYKDEIEFCEEPYETLIGADALLILTEWPQYRTPDFELLGNTLKSRTIFDGRNLYDPSVMRDFGFSYFSIGRDSVGLEVSLELAPSLM